MSNGVKLTNLKTLVSGEVKNAIAKFAYKFGTFCKDVLKTHLSKCTISLLKMHNSESIISFASCISSLAAVLKSLGCKYDLKKPSIMTQVVSKLPSIMKELRSLPSVKRCCQMFQILMSDFAKKLRHMNLGVAVRISEDLRKIQGLVSINHPQNICRCCKS